jgi:hypothetical protein
MHCRQKLFVSALLTLFLCCGNSFAADARSEGEQWLKWSDETRSAYVAGYLWGFGQGFSQGCTIGQETYSVKPTGLPGEKCVAKIPSELKNPEQYAEIITNYYRSYPSDRNVAVRRLLDGLQRKPDLTIEQMHEYYPSSAKKMQEAR